MEKILILGQGGHAKSLINTIENMGTYEIIGCITNDKFATGKYPTIGNDSNLDYLFLKGIKNAAIGIGYLGNSNVRRKLYFKLKEIGYNLPIICDPTAQIGSDVIIDEGTFIGKGAIVNTSTQIGKMCIINTGVLVEHDCYIGDFSHVAVGSVLCGTVNVGDSVFIGANATIIQGIEIGRDTIVGAGSVVIKNIGEKKIVAGIPAMDLEGNN